MEWLRLAPGSPSAGRAQQDETALHLHQPVDGTWCRGSHPKQTSLQTTGRFSPPLNYKNRGRSGKRALMHRSFFDDVTWLEGRAAAKCAATTTSSLSSSVARFALLMVILVGSISPIESPRLRAISRRKSSHLLHMVHSTLGGSARCSQSSVVASEGAMMAAVLPVMYGSRHYDLKEFPRIALPRRGAAPERGNPACVRFRLCKRAGPPPVALPRRVPPIFLTDVP